MLIPLLVLIVLATVVILITGFWPLVVENIFPNITWGLYSREFFAGVLGEAHGTLIDFLVVGLVLVWFERRKATVSETKFHIKMLADLKFYSGVDASFRVFSEVRSLIEMGVNPFSLSQLRMDNLLIEEMTFRNVNMIATIFTDTIIKKTDFFDCNCEAAVFVSVKFSHVKFLSVNAQRANFHGAKMASFDFTESDIRNAKFNGANLRSANFKGVDCKGVVFKDADLRSANFLGAKNVTLAQLQMVAKDVKHIKI